MSNQAASVESSLPRYTAWKHLHDKAQWPGAVPDWAKDYSGRMNDGVAAQAVIEELRAEVTRLAAQAAPTEAEYNPLLIDGVQHDPLCLKVYRSPLKECDCGASSRAAQPSQAPVVQAVRHVCGLQGFGAIGDVCPACAADRAHIEASRTIPASGVIGDQ